MRLVSKILKKWAEKGQIAAAAGVPANGIFAVVGVPANGIFAVVGVPANGILLLFLAILTVWRLTWLGCGGAAMADEFRYWATAKMLAGAAAGDFAAAIGPMFDLGGRPGLALAQLPPMLGQVLLYMTAKIDPRSPDSLLILQVWNVAVAAAASWFFFKTSVKTLGFSIEKGAKMTVVFSLLAAQNLYLRHALPYDFALAFFLFLLSRFEKMSARPAVLGAATAFGYSIYPGFWPLGAAVFLPLLASRQQQTPAENSKKKPETLLKKVVGETPTTAEKSSKAARFIVGFVAVLAGFELLARLAGRSFLASSASGGGEFLRFLNLPFDGGFRFLADYLWTVEGPGGAMLLLGSAAFFVGLGRRFFLEKRPLGRLEILAFSLLAAFLMQDAIGHFSGQKVFYGRLLKAFLPGLIWTAAAVFWSEKARRLAVFFAQKMKKPRAESLLILAEWAVFACFFSRFCLFSIEFSVLEYPRDALAALGFSEKVDSKTYDQRGRGPRSDGLKMIEECEPPASWITLPPVGFSPPPRPDSARISRLVFLNFNTVRVPTMGLFQPFEPLEKGRFLIEKPHFNGFEPHWFDEDLAGRRRLLDGKKLRLAVFEIDEKR